MWVSVKMAVPDEGMEQPAGGGNCEFGLKSLKIEGPGRPLGGVVCDAVQRLSSAPGRSQSPQGIC